MSRSVLSLAVAGCVLTIGRADVAFSQSVARVGIEFQVNAHTSIDQASAAVGMDGDGDFVIVWSSVDQDGSEGGIFARRFSAAGIGLGAEFLVNSVTKFDQRDPSIAADTGGGFVIVWSSYGQDGSDHGVFARLFNAAGVGLGAEFQVNGRTTSAQTQPAVDVDGNGDFVVGWQSSSQDGSGEGVFARRFKADGTAVGAEFPVNAYTSSDQVSPAVATDADGDFVIAWVSGHDGSVSGVFARRFNSAGGGLGDEFQVNAFTTSLQWQPAVGMNGAGDFIVAWSSFGQTGDFFSQNDIFARRFDAAGVGLGDEFQINGPTVGDQAYAAVGVEVDGRFVVVWQSAGGLGEINDVVSVRRFGADGVALGGELQVSSYMPSFKHLPAVGIDGDGSFVVAWSSNGQDGSEAGIFAQRMETLAVLDIDANGTVGPLTDGLLVLRFLFGFTGATLVSGAVDVTHCTRCNAPAIEGYLQTLI